MERGAGECAVFIPAYGAGDRYTFVSCLEEFERVSLSPTVILGPPEWQATLNAWLPNLSIPYLPFDQLSSQELHQQMWSIGHAEPGVGKTFFTWHRAWRDGIEAEVHEHRCGSEPGWLNHKLLVRKILGLPLEVSDRESMSSPIRGKNLLLLCPFAISIRNHPISFWIEIAQRLEAEGFECVFNGLFLHPYEQKGYLYELPREFHVISGNMSELMTHARNAAFILGNRSGLIDIFSREGLSYGVVQAKRMSAFWDIPAFWGSTPKFQFVGEDPPEVDQVVKATLDALSHEDVTQRE